MNPSNDAKVKALQRKVDAITDTVQESVILMQRRDESLEHLSAKSNQVQEKSAVFYREVHHRRRWYIRFYHFVQRRMHVC